MDVIAATPASPGVAVAPPVIVRVPEPPPRGTTSEHGTSAEVERLEAACLTAAAELEGFARSVEEAGNPDEAAIFSAHATMAKDPGLAAGAKRAIEEHLLDASAAVLVAAEEIAEQLRAVDSDLLAERAVDLLDVAERIARRAAGVPDAELPALDAPVVVLAEDLPPSVTARLPREFVAGFAMEQGSVTSHVAILARAYGIPAVVGARGMLGRLDPDVVGTVAVDGTAGEVYVEPDEDTLTRLRSLLLEFEREVEVAYEEASLPPVTQDGTRVTLLANIGTPEEADDAVALGAEGVGLFRTEFLFAERASAPGEDEQADAYRAVVEAFAPHPVIIRLLDVGGDKPLPYLRLPDEANPFLGVRALRIAHDRPELFTTQLRAAMRAATAGTVKVMAPMVANADDAALLVELASRARQELEHEEVPHGEIHLGVMLEIPGAILSASSFFSSLEFASLGTNDLLQYTMAADRGNPALERYQDPLHPGLLRLIATAADAATSAGIELSVCGEMAGDPQAVLILMGLGIRRFSMTPRSLAAVRRAVRGSDLTDLQRAAAMALQAASAEAVRSLEL